jgi:hypothetical protein
MPRGAYRPYTIENLQKAVEAVKNGMAKKKAAVSFGVPRTTLLDRIYQRVPEDTTSSGPSSILTEAEESVLKGWAIKMSRMGFPITKSQLQWEVKKILEKDGRPNPFKDNLPGKHSVAQISLGPFHNLSYRVGGQRFILRPEGGG